MNIKTITFIYETLKDEVRIKEKAFEKARTLYNEAQDNDAPNALTLESLKDKTRLSYYEAKNALFDFENTDFR